MTERYVQMVLVALRAILQHAEDAIFNWDDVLDTVVHEGLLELSKIHYEAGRMSHQAALKYAQQCCDKRATIHVHHRWRHHPLEMYGDEGYRSSNRKRFKESGGGR